MNCFIATWCAHLDDLVLGVYATHAEAKARIEEINNTPLFAGQGVTPESVDAIRKIYKRDISTFVGFNLITIENGEVTHVETFHHE